MSWSASWVRCGGGERVGHFETKRVRKDGTVIEVSVSVSPIRDAAGEVVGAATLARDVTERVRAEAERRVLERELQQAERLETLGQVAGGIAHDFNNVLAAIIGYARSVAEEAGDNPRLKGDIGQIQLAAQRAARLTRQLLIIGRQDVSQPEALDLNAVLEGIRDLVHTSMGRHIQLLVEPAAGAPGVRGRPGPGRAGGTEPGRERPRRDAWRRHGHGRDTCGRIQRGSGSG